MRNRLDNWSTKRLTKTTWTGLIYLDFKFFLFRTDMTNVSKKKDMWEGEYEPDITPSMFIAS